MAIIKPPSLEYDHRLYGVFLAGSIEMGAAEDWQKVVGEAINRPDANIFNPRRDDWDSSWEQSIDNPEFHEQVTWELFHIERSELLLFYFAPGTSSPITLFELGLIAGDNNNTGHRTILVCCPDGFWRKGNVDIIADRYSITTVNTIEELIHYAQLELENSAETWSTECD